LLLEGRSARPIIAYDDLETRMVSNRAEEAVNVIISNRATHETIARYEIHLASETRTPAESEYLDDAWQRAVADGLVASESRADYEFQLQRPKTLYESSH
jgi:hypothetical protein